MKLITLTIVRDGREITVEVSPDNWAVGWEDDGTRHELTLLESEDAIDAIAEAEAKPISDEDDSFPGFHAGQGRTWK
jgi:hypothetical protein